MKNIMRTILALVCFASGVIVTFEWLGHDRGQRIYTMLKRPEVVIKVIEGIKEKPIIVSDDALILATNQAYREVLVKVSGMEYDSRSSKKTWLIMQNYVDTALKYSESLLVEEN